MNRAAVVADMMISVSLCLMDRWRTVFLAAAYSLDVGNCRVRRREALREIAKSAPFSVLDWLFIVRLEGN